MAARKGIVDKALASKPVKKAKGLIDAAIDAFNDPPLAPDDMPAKPRRSAPRAAGRKTAAKSSSRKTAAKSSARRTMDRKLISGMEDYEVKYLATKHGVTQKAVRAAVAAVGSSRNKVEAEIRRRGA
jgi:hypothetical protein